MKYPVAIVHKGSQEYLKWSLMQAKNFANQVVLIGDESNRRFNHIADHQDLRQLKSSYADEFRKLYSHMSDNSYNFEFFCFERWFILYEYMIRNEIDVIVHLDSDVLLYNTSELEFRHNIDETICAYHIPDQSYQDMKWFASGHCSFWTRDGLGRFCLFILEKYRHHLAELKKKWDWHQDTKMEGGICDMTLLYLFYKENHKIIQNNAKSDKGFTYDMNINTADNFYSNEYETKRTWLLNHNKKIFFPDHLPYCLNIMEGAPVQFLCLHCQGRTKLLMYHFYTGHKNIIDFFAHWMFVTIFLRRKLTNKMKALFSS